MCDAKSRPLIIIKTRLSLSQLLNAESFYCSTTSSEYPDLQIKVLKLCISRYCCPDWRKTLRLVEINGCKVCSVLLQHIR